MRTARSRNRGGGKCGTRDRVPDDRESCLRTITLNLITNGLADLVSASAADDQRRMELIMVRIDKIDYNAIFEMGGNDVVLMYRRPVGRASTEVIIRDVGRSNPRKIRIPSNRSFLVK